MEHAVALTRAILGPICQTDAEARGALHDAERSGLDPMAYFTDRLHLDPKLALSRAADWGGVRSGDRISGTLAPTGALNDVNAFITRRSVCALVDGQPVLYCAPTFAMVLRLGALLASRPALRDSICLVSPKLLNEVLVAHISDRLLQQAQDGLLHRLPLASAKYRMTFWVRLTFVLFLLLVPLAMAILPFQLQPVLLPAIVLIVVLPSMVRLISALWPAPKVDPETPLLSDDDLPIYSVLIPLRDEAKMVPMLARAMERMDYPSEKLEIIFVVESSSAATIATVKRLKTSRFACISVPDALPRTKPKAMEFALPLAKGEFVVIFDAEDIPERSQLRKAASRFRADPTLDCLQAALVIENAGETWLTAMFAGEYAGQFGFLLPTLAAWRLPLPLGGTSNHFRVRSLREAGGWDPYNVTEDADLGIRLARLGYRTGTLDSHTLEEAPLTLHAWVKQRTRWMKGWMQTALVHNRAPRKFLGEIGWKGFLSTNLYLANMVLSPLLHSVFLGRLLLEFAVRGLDSDWLLDPWSALYALTLLIGYGGAYAIVIAGLAWQKRLDLLVGQLLLPIYWLLHAAATLRAMNELLWHPYFWAKTTHGLSRFRREADSQARPTLKAPALQR
jgi:glycosyltransferase XagB